MHMNGSINNDDIAVLMEEHRPMLSSYLRLLVRYDHHLAEDLVQETMITAYKMPDAWGTREQFGPWLRGIARNKVRENRRAMSRRPLVVDSDVVKGVEQVYSVFDAAGGTKESWRDRLALVHECIEALKVDMREVVSKFYELGHTLDEIAGLMAISRATIAQRLSRARNLIRSCVAIKTGQENNDGH